MGRSSKPEQSADAPKFQENYAANPGSLYDNRQTATAQPNRAMSESESIARDIKEGRLSGFVGHGTVLSGETNFQAMLRIDGHLTGRVTSENGTLIVGSSGRVDANIMVAAAVIGGTVNGDIIALEKVELGRTARVLGNIQSPRIVIEDGAIFEGSCSMLKAKEISDKRAAEAKSRIEGSDSSMPDVTDNYVVEEEISEAAAN